MPLKTFLKKGKKSEKEREVFLDYASGTPISPEVLKEMMPYFSDIFYNPSTIYQGGFDARKALEKSRAEIAKAISARPQEIIFTDGGTEANNLVIRGLIFHWREKNQNKKAHIITSSIEHASVLETCKFLEKKGLVDVSYLSVDEHGLIDIKELKKNIGENTVLVSIGYVNGEIGIIQNIREIAKTLRHYRKHHKTSFPYFHTDAIQATNYFDINVQKLGVDFMSLNASKIYGPKKIALLYKKAGIEIDPLITGGSQELALRAGTENIPYIVAFAKALVVAQENYEKEYERMIALRDYAEKLLKEKIDLDFIINGEGAERSPHIVNISIPRLSSEEIVLRLDARGIQASMKSACKTGEDGDSHVVKSLRKENTQSLRFSFGRATTKKDIAYMMDNLSDILRKMQKTFEEYGE